MKKLKKKMGKVEFDLGERRFILVKRGEISTVVEFCLRKEMSSRLAGVSGFVIYADTKKQASEGFYKLADELSPPIEREPISLENQFNDHLNYFFTHALSTTEPKVLRDELRRLAKMADMLVDEE
jgi:hypothetical protein